MRFLSVDLETYSSADLPSCGVYRYASSPDFEILIIGYSFDGGPVQVHDCTEPGPWPEDFLEALTDPEVEKRAWNAPFERTCLAAALGKEMPPEQWSDSMVLALECGLPGSLAGAGIALGLPEDKLKDPIGKSLIQYFSKPCRPTKSNNGRTRNLPGHDREKWKLYIEYNRQDVVTEMAIRQKLDRYKLAESEQHLWELDQRMNDRGVRLDVPMVNVIVAHDEQNREKLQAEAREITGLSNPNSLSQLKPWLQSRGVGAEALRKDDVAKLLAGDLPEDVRRALEIRQALGKTSVAKYHAMQDAVCPDGRLRGILQFYGANRSGRWAGRIVQTHNLARNSLPDLYLARELAAEDDFETMELLFGETSFVLSELIRTAFIPSEGRRFVVSDFSAIEARVLAWLAGEDWVLEAFRNGKDIYCETASMMYHVPVVKHGVNGELRQKGKIATLACGYQGGVGAMKAMDREGAIPEEELQAVVEQWRTANPKIVKLWRTCELAARKAIAERCTVKVRGGVLRFSYHNGNLFIQLPSGRRLCYWDCRLKTNPDTGRDQIVYMGVNQMTKQWGETETYGGKLVENCLAGDTPVLTDSGWKPIRDIVLTDLLWDGVEWVRHYGLIMHDKRQTITVDGVRMTPDHRILTEEGWQNASSCKEHYRPDVRLPDSCQLCRIEWQGESVEREMQRLRENGDSPCKRNAEGKAEILRMHEIQADLRKEKKSWNVEEADLECMALHEAEMRKSEGTGLEELRRTRDQRVPGVVGEFRGFLPGHGARIQPGTDARQDRCERELRAGELQVGHPQRAGAEHQTEPDGRYTVGADDSNRGIGTVRDRRDDTALQAGPRDHGYFSVCEAGRQEYVYDIRSAGPRSRFTVQSDAGPMIVHNCTQATARDCLAEAMTRVTAMGYEIVMHVHDEMIVDVPLEDTDALKTINKAMSDPIDWAPGLPLKGDGYECAFYMKD